MKQRIYKTIIKPLLLIRRLLDRLIRFVAYRLRLVDASMLKDAVVNDLSSQQAADIHKRKGDIPASFTTLLHYRTQQQTSANEKLPDWHINNKLIGREIAKESGAVVPKIYQKMVTRKDIEFRDNIVIKPFHSAGSKGVFLVKNNREIMEVKQNKKIASIAALKQRLANFDDDRWLVEERIARPDDEQIHDLKFYCCYGVVVLVLEKNNHGRICFWRPDGTRIDSGKYSKKEQFHGRGFRDDYLPMVEKLSLQLPVPFMRIDYLDTKTQLVFGEFTPQPGNYHKMNQPLDRLLGKEFLAAEQRLQSDLLKGRSFDIYKKALKKVQ